MKIKGTNPIAPLLAILVVVVAIVVVDFNTANRANAQETQSPATLRTPAIPISYKMETTIMRTAEGDVMRYHDKETGVVCYSPSPTTWDCSR